MTWPTSTAVASTEYVSLDHYNNLRTDMLATMRDSILVSDYLTGTLVPATTGTVYLWLKGLHHPEEYTLSSSMNQSYGIFMGHRNILSGVTASQSGWATAPTTLANCTDESLSTVTGVGTSTQTADDLSYVQFDLGATNTGLALLRFVVGATPSTGICKVKHSVDGAAWTTAETFTVANAGTNNTIETHCYALTGPRYLRLTNYMADTSTASYLRIHEAAFFLDYAVDAAVAANTWSSISMTTATAASGQTDRSLVMTLPATAPTSWFLNLMASSTSS